MYSGALGAGRSFYTVRCGSIYFFALSPPFVYVHERLPWSSPAMEKTISVFLQTQSKHVADCLAVHIYIAKFPMASKTVFSCSYRRETTQENCTPAAVLLNLFLPCKTDRQEETYTCSAGYTKTVSKLFPEFQNRTFWKYRTCRTLSRPFILISRKMFMRQISPGVSLSERIRKAIGIQYSSLSLSLSSCALPLLSRIVFWHVPKAARSV